MIGRRIDALEQRLGVRLMHRSTRRLALTEQGAVYLEHCRRSRRRPGAGRSAARATAGTRPPAISSSSAPAAFGRQHVAPHGPSFVAQNPDVRVSFGLTTRSSTSCAWASTWACASAARSIPSSSRSSSPRTAASCAPRQRISSGTACRARSRTSRAQLPRVQPAGRTAGRLALPAGRQAGRRCASPAISSATTRELLHRWACEGLGLVVAVDVGDRARARARRARDRARRLRAAVLRHHGGLSARNGTCRRRSASSSST